jgi:Glycosyltransferase sugar-binding region containing DXD motif/Alpha 1,4-glycosyltransferase conserved region
MTDPIQSLWIGGELSPMERLSIASFLAHGHEYHLYCYGEVGGLPEGAALKNAEEILPKKAIFQYQQHPSYSGFSNFFRYRLLLQNGGWWADTDVVCLKQFAFDAPYVFAAEQISGSPVAASAVIKAPAGSEIMAFNWHVCLSCADPAGAAWGQFGPRLMARAISKFGLGAHIQAPEVFCPLAYDEWETLVLPAALRFSEQTHAVHLWNEMWRRAGCDKTAAQHPGSPYENLKREYLSEAKPGRRVIPSVASRS